MHGELDAGSWTVGIVVSRIVQRGDQGVGGVGDARGGSAAACGAQAGESTHGVEQRAEVAGPEDRPVLLAEFVEVCVQAGPAQLNPSAGHGGAERFGLAISRRLAVPKDDHLSIGDAAFGLSVVAVDDVALRDGLDDPGAAIAAGGVVPPVPVTGRVGLLPVREQLPQSGVGERRFDVEKLSQNCHHAVT